MNKPNQNIITEIKEIRTKGNFQTVKKHIGKERLIEFFNSVYPNFSLPEIEAITGIPDSTLQHWFKNLQIPLTRAHIKNIAVPGTVDSETIVTLNGTANRICTIKITPELAYIIGFSLGDGNIEKYSTAAFNRDITLKQPILEALKEYGTVTQREREDGLWLLRLSNVKIANLIKDENGIRYDTIKFILSEEELAKRFLAGFWDAEGTVRQEGNYFHIYLYNTNEKLMNHIKESLTNGATNSANDECFNFFAFW